MNSRQLTVGVIYGGMSAEAEVSAMSAEGVREALLTSGCQVVDLIFDAGLPEALQKQQPDVIFPAVHGPPGEDGTLQGLLDLMGLPYVGSGVEASVLGMNKLLSKQQFRLAGLKVPEEQLVTNETNTPDLQRQISARFGERMVVKPTSQGSALGTCLLESSGQLPEALAAALALDSSALVEPRIPGREITCAVLETAAGCRSLPVIEITTPESSWYDYEHRYTKGLSEHICPAPLADKLLRRIESVAAAAHRSLGCRDLSRADFILDGEDCWLLEVNTLPGMTATSLFPDAAGAAGISFADLMLQLVQQAWQRGPRFGR